VGTFDGKGVLVTGGAGGIGEAICFAFAWEGARVVCADNSNRPRVMLMFRAANVRRPGSYTFHHMDVTKKEDCRDAAVAGFIAPISILVNCAGVQPKESAVSAHELSEEMWDLILGVNLKGAWLMCKYVIPQMLASPPGVIINIGSVTASYGAHGIAAYAASKGGLIALTRALAIEYAPRIRVLAISPGSVDTALLRETLAGQSKTSNPNAAVAELGAAYPIGRIVTPEEVVRTVLFAASDAASAITGTEIMVDGGVTAQGQWAMRPV